MVTGSGLVVAGAELVAAGICWCRKVAAGVCWCRKAVTGAGLTAAAGKWPLVSAGAGRGSCRCSEVVVGAGLAAASVELVAASTEKWPPVQEASCWCHLKEY